MVMQKLHSVNKDAELQSRNTLIYTYIQKFHSIPLLHSVAPTHTHCSTLTSTSSHRPWISLMLLYPASPRLVSRSARVCLMTCSTPAWPPTTEPYTQGRPTEREGDYNVSMVVSGREERESEGEDEDDDSRKTPCAPNASALMMSLPVLMPESNKTVSLPSFWAARTLGDFMMSSRASREGIAPSTWRPPWLETIMPSTLYSRAFSAS